jgi:hypothetical protein
MVKKKSMRIKNLLTILFFLVLFSPVVFSQSGAAQYKDPAFIDSILQRHNNYRAALHVAPLSWSATLAADALAWARHLAQIDQGQHDGSIRGREGENLWWGTTGAFSYGEMVGFWGGEQKDFVYGVFPDCKARRSAVVGHYTQMIWKNTTTVGCALVGNGKTDYLVCRYASAGNVEGEKPY